VKGNSEFLLKVNFEIRARIRPKTFIKLRPEPEPVKAKPGLNNSGTEYVQFFELEILARYFVKTIQL